MLCLQQAGPAQAAGQAALPASLPRTTASDIFRPVHLRAVSYASPASLKVLADIGDTGAGERGTHYKALLDYFLAGLSLPEDVFLGESPPRLAFGNDR